MIVYYIDVNDKLIRHDVVILFLYSTRILETILETFTIFFQGITT